MEAVEKIRSGNKILRIFQDDYTENPRLEFDNLGTMICFHKNYKLGDKHEYDSSDYNSWDEVEKAIINNENPAVILPLYLFDHGGITMKTTPFSCNWDSGQVGFIFISKEKVREVHGVKRISSELKERIKNYLESEVKTYDQYLTGDVYGFTVSEVETCNKGHEHEEEIDSCHGFYGENPFENGMIDCIEDEELIEAIKQKYEPVTA